MKYEWKDEGISQGKRTVIRGSCTKAEEVCSAIFISLLSCGMPCCCIPDYWSRRIVKPMQNKTEELFYLGGDIVDQPTGRDGDSPTSYNDLGTHYGTRNIVAYIKYKHGIDGHYLLNHRIEAFLDNLKGRKFLDIGCGGGDWAVYAAKKHPDMSIWGIDIQAGMITAASTLQRTERIDKHLNFLHGDAGDITFASDNMMDACSSILVTSNLPSKELVLKHFQEMHRVLKPGGSTLFVYPDSIYTTFTSGQDRSIEILDELKDKLTDFNAENVLDDQNIAESQEFLEQFKHILKATFYIQDGKLQLATAENPFDEGNKIIRKLGKAVIPNHYYSWNYYKECIEQVNLTIKERIPCKIAENNEELLEFFTQNPTVRLGNEYVNNAPYGFVILTKPGQPPTRSPTPESRPESIDPYEYKKFVPISPVPLSSSIQTSAV